MVYRPLKDYTFIIIALAITQPCSQNNQGKKPLPDIKTVISFNYYTVYDFL